MAHKPVGRTPPEQRLARRLASSTGRRLEAVRTNAAAGLRELGRVDIALYRAVAETPTPTLDQPMRRLTDAADRSRLWLLISAAMAAVGTEEVQRAARVGVLALAVDSAAVNIGFKITARRERPDRDLAGVPAGRRASMPHSTSFPSGHAASGFAFASAVAQTLPAAAAPLRLLAAAVGYSRVHTGVHYPGDVIIGALIGTTVGQVVGWSCWRHRAGARH